MNKLIAIFLIFSIGATAMSEQDPLNVWKTLSKITFKKEYDDLMGFEVDVPIFSKDVKKLDGKEILIRGYILPVESYKDQNYFAFSAFPYNMCYFCGGAGPESVMDVYAKEGKAIRYTADMVTLKGTLQLNSGDINQLMYILKDAEKVK